TSFREMQKKYPLELTGQCKNECSLKIDFEDILPEVDVEKLEKNYPTLKIPDPRYFCRSFHKENKPSLEVLYSIFNDEIQSFSKEDFKIITQILFKGCDAFKERANLIKGTISACQRMCPIPRLRYYRCEEPMKFYRRVSSPSAILLKDLNQILKPLEAEIEKEFVNGGDKVESIKKNYKETILKVRDYLAVQKIKPKKLKGHEKHVLA
ncbi:MAG: hypothetical protein NXH75_12115, partial [Halobacteriovoraceae bacterium]|nr:hypothetical protein [Halobacteriovoraceae bacterium]